MTDLRDASLDANHILEFRRGPASDWTAVNPVLRSGEPGHETDTGKVKLGDGATAWTSLPYLGDPAGYKQVVNVGSRVDATAVTGVNTFALAEQINGAFNGSQGARGVFQLKSGLLVPANRVGKLRMLGLWMTNTVAPAITLALGLYPITGSPAAGATAVSATPGAVIAASVVNIATPAATSMALFDTGDFDMPADGAYSVGFASSGAMAASSSIELRAQLFAASA